MKGYIRKRGTRYYPWLELPAEHDPETGARARSRVALGGFARKGDAEDALEDAIEAARRGWRGPSRVTLSDYLHNEWLPGVDLELAVTTAALYRTIAEAYVIPRLGGRRLDTLSSADLTRLYAELLESGGRGGRALAPRTVRHVHTTLRKALADAVEARLIPYNPAEAAKAPRRTETREPAVWTPEQVRAFLAVAIEDRLAALWTLAASTGMRRSELLGLRWSDLNLDMGDLSVRQVWVAYGKTHALKEPKTEASRRTMPLSPAAVLALRRHRKSQQGERFAAGPAYESSGLVFTDELGAALPPDQVSAAFRRIAKAAGLPPLTLHGLRHTFATVGLDAGVDVLYVAELLGHSTPSVTMNIYQHVRRDRLTGAASAIADALSG
jgi:integrase